MCYYNGQRVSKAEFIRLMNLEKATKDYDFLDIPLLDGFTFGPTAVMVKNDENTDFDIVQMEWGFIPEYVTNDEQLQQMRRGYLDAKGFRHKPYTMLNARGDELFKIDAKTGKKKVYYKAAEERRCLIPASEFYEWQHIYRKKKNSDEYLATPDKYPYHIAVKNQSYYLLAAIWQDWVNRDTGEIRKTVALVTTKANSLMKQIHNSQERMPTILPQELAYEWMFGDLDQQRITEIANYQIPSSDLVAYTVEKNFKTSGTPDKPFTYKGVEGLVHAA